MTCHNNCETGHKVEKALHDIGEAGRHEFETIEKKVREKPGQSLLLAFAAGVVCSLLAGRR